MILRRAQDIEGPALSKAEQLRLSVVVREVKSHYTGEEEGEA